MQSLRLPPALPLAALLLACATLAASSSAQLPLGFHMSLAPLSAHFFTRLSDVLRFIALLDCHKDGGVICGGADRGSMLTAFLGDDFISTSLAVNSLTTEQLQQPLEVDGVCYGVASTTFDIAYTMPSSVSKLQRHVYGMFSGAAIKVTSNLHDPSCSRNIGTNSSSRRERIEHLPSCWQREAISLSEHLTGVTQEALNMSSWPLMANSPSPTGGSAKCPCAGIDYTQTHMRQRTNAQALVPIPCASSPADIHLSVALNMTVSFAACPICEHVAVCSLATGGAGHAHAAADTVQSESDECGLEVAAESPPVPARMEARFMAHATVDEAEVQQQQAREGGQSSQLPNDLLDSSLMQRRSRVAAGSSSSYMCTNLKHMYTHGYQGTIVWERWQLQEFLQARKRVCRVSNVCWANGRLTMYLPELARDFSWPQSTPEGFRAEGWDGMLHLHAFEKMWIKLPWDADNTVSQWTPVVEKSHIPEGFTFADDARVHSLFRSSHQKNFGHVFSDDMLSTQMALDVFDLSPEDDDINGGRIVLLEHPDDKQRIVNINRFSSNQGFSWYWGMFQKNATFVEDYGHGTCFRSAVMGHTSAFSVAYFTQMRGPSAKAFRRRYAHNLGMTWLYPTRKQQQLLQQQQQQGKHRVVLYCKTGGSNGPVWPHLCSYVPVLKRAFPDAEIFCVFLDNMAINIQLAIIASATVHVIAHGGMSYALLFASDGAAAIVLVEHGVQKAKELQVIGQLSWLHMYVLHRHDEAALMSLVWQASVDASRSWLGGGVLKPLEPSPCAADAMIAAKATHALKDPLSCHEHQLPGLPRNQKCGAA